VGGQDPVHLAQPVARRRGRGASQPDDRRSRRPTPAAVQGLVGVALGAAQGCLGPLRRPLVPSSAVRHSGTSRPRRGPHPASPSVRVTGGTGGCGVLPSRSRFVRRSPLPGGSGERARPPGQRAGAGGRPSPCPTVGAKPCPPGTAGGAACRAALPTGVVTAGRQPIVPPHARGGVWTVSGRPRRPRTCPLRQVGTPAPNASRGLRALRATSGPDPAAPVGLEGLAVTAPAAGGGGGLRLSLTGRRPARGALTAGQVRDLRRRWAAAAGDGTGELEIGEDPPWGGGTPAPPPVPRGGAVTRPV